MLVGPPEVDGLGVLIFETHLVKHLAHNLWVDALEGHLVILALEVAELKAISKVKVSLEILPNRGLLRRHELFYGWG